MMNVLELFFGNGSFSRSCLEFGAHITGVDIEPCPANLTDKIEYYQEDILSVHPIARRKFNIVWASPPCQTYSILAIFTEDRRKCRAITDKARLHDSYVKMAIEMMIFAKPHFAVIENPVGCLRKQSFMDIFERVTVTYCQYGDSRQKPTDLFFYPRKPKDFIPRKCERGDTCHTPAPRGSTNPGSTQGIHQDLKARVPKRLCDELAAIFWTITDKVDNK